MKQPFPAKNWLLPLVVMTTALGYHLPTQASTIASDWVTEALNAVRANPIGPTPASRAYGILGTAMYDAWSAYEFTPISTQLGDTLQRPLIENTEANKTEAISYAAHRVLSNLFPTQVSVFNARMSALGFDPNTPSTTAANIGVQMAQALIAFRSTDGSNQANGYVDNSGYVPVNSSPNNIVDITRWTPEHVPIDNPSGPLQTSLTPQWGNVTPFALSSGSEFRPPEPEPFLLPGNIVNPAFIAQAQAVIDYSANLTDEQKLIAEFWEDGGGTPFPPGHWMAIGQFVCDRDSNTLDEDVKLFFGLGNAVMDAGIATWEAKRFYDYTRPVRAIRELGRLGLIGTFDAGLGGFAIDAWAGPGLGTQRILATDFNTYQTPGGNPSPPFSEHTSGHSAFSAAGAEILRLFTGNDNYGDSVSFAPGSSLFEPGITPIGPVTLSWATFSEAADEAGFSRRYGGIHFENGDLDGRTIGRQVGARVWTQTQFFINGGVQQVPESSSALAVMVIGGVLFYSCKREG